METKHCPSCDTTRPVSDFYLNRGRADGLSGYCAECQRVAENRRKYEARLRLIADLGGACVRCGFDDPRALQVDHVNGDGAVDRIEHPNSNSATFYKAVREHPERYALMCANCNWIKRAERQEVIGRRVYTRTQPQTKRQGEGRWSEAANARRSETAKASWTPEKRAEKAVAMQAKATGRKMVTSPDGKRHWSYPGDEDYPG